MFVAGAGERKIKLSSDDSNDATLHDFAIVFSPSINLKGADRWEIAMINCNTWFTTYNISTDYNNRHVKSYNGAIYQEWREAKDALSPNSFIRAFKERANGKEFFE